MLNKLEEAISVLFTKPKIFVTIEYICALKKLHFGTDVTGILAAQKEIDAPQKLQGHHGIVHLHNSVRYKASIWLEMEFCEEGSLNKFFWNNQQDFNSRLKFQLMVELEMASASNISTITEWCIAI